MDTDLISVSNPSVKGVMMTNFSNDELENVLEEHLPFYNTGRSQIKTQLKTTTHIFFLQM